MKTISPDERALIDAAIERGKVTQLAPAAPRRGTAPDPQVATRRLAVAQAYQDGHSILEIAKLFNVTTATINNDLTLTGTPRTKRLGNKRGQGDKAMLKKRARAAKQAEKRAEPKDRRRFPITPVATGQINRMAAADAKGTMFPTRVVDPAPSDSVLVDGCNNSKIGGDVLVGWLKGARIYTLTLEERTTCPSSCPLWRGCYGNSMHYARRWKHGPELEARIRAEVPRLLKDYGRILVRLHVLGDFYSFDYLAMWAELLDQNPGLNIFGFTAWPVKTQIGAGVARLREAYPHRFAVRTSGTSGPWGGFTLDFKTLKPRIGDAAVCPEQRAGIIGGDETRHCGNCGLCWKGSTPIAFVEH